MLNGNHEIITQKQKRNKNSPHWDLKHGPLDLKAGMLPMSCADPSFVIFRFFSVHTCQAGSKLVHVSTADVRQLDLHFSQRKV